MLEPRSIVQPQPLFGAHRADLHVAIVAQVLATQLRLVLEHGSAGAHLIVWLKPVVDAFRHVPVEQLQLVGKRRPDIMWYIRPARPGLQATKASKRARGSN